MIPTVGETSSTVTQPVISEIPTTLMKISLENIVNSTALLFTTTQNFLNLNKSKIIIPRTVDFKLNFEGTIFPANLRFGELMKILFEMIIKQGGTTSTIAKTSSTTEMSDLILQNKTENLYVTSSTFNASNQSHQNISHTTELSVVEESALTKSKKNELLIKIVIIIFQMII